MREAVAALNPFVISEQSLARFADPRRIVFNVNSPEDVSEAEDLLAGRTTRIRYRARRFAERFAGDEGQAADTESPCRSHSRASRLTALARGYARQPDDRPQIRGGMTMAKILCVLYDDPADGYPPDYARDEIPEIEGYPDGQSTPTPQAVDFEAGELLGCVSGALGLRKFCEDNGHELIVTSDKEGEDSEFERHLPDAEVVISQPFWPAYLTAERIAKAPKLKLAITAGIGSDHVDLDAAVASGITVAEVTYSNSISVSEHVVMMILSLVRNYIPSYQIVARQGLEHRRCRFAQLRRRGDADRHRRSGQDRHRGAAPAEAVRGRPALHRSPPPSRRGRSGAGADLPRVDRGDGPAPGRGHDQRAASSRDRAPLRRGDDRRR